MRRRTVLLTGLLTLVMVAGAQAMTPFGRRAKARATADAAQALAAVKLPAGARRVRGDQSVKGVLGLAPMRFRNSSQR